ncbi:hypothetical protein B0H34DRAFT_679583 [Crassisporium funariophilum]|nr:hypothetical protein B0H34DRAFT_679583 [Crassisporium funariophilum]
MFPTTLLATLLLSLSVAANPVVIQRSPVSLGISRRVNVTSAHNLVRHDHNRAQALKALGAAKAAGLPIQSNTVISEKVDNQGGFLCCFCQYSLPIDTGSLNTWVGADKAYVKTKTSTQTVNAMHLTDILSYLGTEFTDQVTLASGLVIPEQSLGVALTVRCLPNASPDHLVYRATLQAIGFNSVNGILGIGPAGLTLAVVID